MIDFFITNFYGPLSLGREGQNEMEMSNRWMHS